jgi:hypothetical protein
VRAITRVVDAGEATDEWLLRLAEVGTAPTSTAQPVTSRSCATERGVDDYLARFDRRALRASRTFDGMMVIEAVLPIEEGEEFLANLRMAVDKASTGAPTAPTAQRRLDALLDMSRHARDGHDVNDTSGADRYTLHLVADVVALAGTGNGRAELLNGAPVAIETLRRMACDCGVVRHLMRGKSEPLDIGRRTSVWMQHNDEQSPCAMAASAASRVARTEPATSTTSGTTPTEGADMRRQRRIGVSSTSHAVAEGGFTVSGDADGELIFRRPDGSVIR